MNLWVERFKFFGLGVVLVGAAWAFVEAFR